MMQVSQEIESRIAIKLPEEFFKRKGMFLGVDPFLTNPPVSNVTLTPRRKPTSVTGDFGNNSSQTPQSGKYPTSMRRRQDFLFLNPVMLTTAALTVSQ